MQIGLAVKPEYKILHIIQSGGAGSMRAEEVDQLRHMVLSMVDEPLVIVVKLADRCVRTYFGCLSKLTGHQGHTDGGLAQGSFLHRQPGVVDWIPLWRAAGIVWTKTSDTHRCLYYDWRNLANDTHTLIDSLISNDGQIHC